MKTFLLLSQFYLYLTPEFEISSQSFVAVLFGGRCAQIEHGMPTSCSTECFFFLMGLSFSLYPSLVTCLSRDSSYSNNYHPSSIFFPPRRLFSGKQEKKKAFESHMETTPFVFDYDDEEAKQIVQLSADHMAQGDHIKALEVIEAWISSHKKH